MIGKTLSHYTVIEKIGQGGMGEVYRAEDTNLSRDVAIKVLPEQFTQDPQRLARFEREAKLLASLNHPNIAAIYGFEQADDVHFLVLELVPGETLAERVARGPLPVEEALEVCRQIAEGVEAAHEKGVIHRDLKPANVKVTPEGKVKILDFGLAKAFEAESPVTDISQSPTLTEEMTRAGVILGTAAYMSPEQAKGKPVDKRADIFAFGCVLYELLTGKRAFGGETVTDTLASILARDPEWEALPEGTPWRIQDLLRRCLTKDPHDRLHEVADVRIEVKLALSEPTTVSPTGMGTTVQTPLWRKAIPWTLTLFMGVVAVSLAYWNVTEPTISPTSGSLTKVTINLSADAPLANDTGIDLAISPDGRRIVYQAQLGSNAQLYLRQLDDVTVTPITGTEGAGKAFFSPDGQSVAFSSGGQLKRVPIMGGTPITITDSLPGSGVRGRWGTGETIMFVVSTLEGGGLYRVSAAGGEVERLSSPDPDRGEVSYRQLDLLPSGNAVLLSVRREDGSFQIIAVSLQTGEQKIVVEGGRAAYYTPTGHLVYEAELTGTLMSAPFDLERVEVTGDPVPILEGVRQSDCCAVDYALSLEGTLVYVPAGGSLRTLVWVDRDGKEMEPLTGVRSGYGIPRLSPDGQRLAVQVQEKAEFDIWVYDINRGTRIRITAQGLNRQPVWTPDGMEIAFVSNQYNLYRKPADGSGERELLPTGERTRTLMPTSWSPDGQTLAFHQATGGRDIWMLHLQSDASSFLATSFRERSAMFSPDGRWLAYVSNESGRFEVYVQAYPGPGGKWPISIEGGTEPLWAREGRELFYRQGNKMMAVAVRTAPTFTAEKPRLLFEGPYVLATSMANYDVSLDGQRFLMIKEEGQGSQINVVLNWFEELERLVPTN